MDEENEFWKMVNDEEVFALRRKRAAMRMFWAIALQASIAVVLFAAAFGSMEWVIVGLLLALFTVERRCGILEQQLEEFEEALDATDDD